ncbi:CsbD family protein [Corynebacterium halotolerans]|uniref:CsbD family protein n=1 Tax=Corynebacterium halotolerans TaxID=225326 RepID=UPI003CF70D90
MGEFQDKAEGLKGKAKEAVGDATDNRDLENEGKGEQVKSDIKDKAREVGDKAKEALGSLKDDDK